MQYFLVHNEFDGICSWLRYVCRLRAYTVFRTGRPEQSSAFQRFPKDDSIDPAGNILLQPVEVLPNLDHFVDGFRVVPNNRTHRSRNDRICVWIFNRWRLLHALGRHGGHG